MTRYSCKIRPVHADGTECTHRIKPSGRPLDPDCPGRAAYMARCGCGVELGPDVLRAVLEERRASHLGEHETRPVRTVELPR